MTDKWIFTYASLILKLCSTEWIMRNCSGPWRCRNGWQWYKFSKNLYWRQTTDIKIENKLSNKINICKRIRQGCVTLFNEYSKYLFNGALNYCTDGIKINEVNISSSHYTDSTINGMNLNRVDRYQYLTWYGQFWFGWNNLGIAFSIHSCWLLLFPVF